ncbi:hypothetical protein NDU88_003672 [Pleurodeles waltl]|uniref:Uncharacterized protein n=1 Tax=Pleurodeles waltl TaxID=8319 RepID=A0AAV7VGQ0_PLEWA|nr:hypothetical protein NDU88_003672 [Pleurodeles waltl]
MAHDDKPHCGNAACQVGFGSSYIDRHIEELRGAWGGSEHSRREGRARAVGWTNEGVERAAALKLSYPGVVHWDGRSRAPAGVPGSPAKTGMVQGDRGGLHRPLDAHRQPPNTYTQNGTAMWKNNRVIGLAFLELNGHTVLDYDEETLEVGEVQEVCE